jgi:heme-binding HmuY-like protein
MKKTQLASVFAAFAFAAMLPSCKKDNDSKPPVTLTATTTKNLVADATINTDHFSFYSLETNQAVSSKDSASTKWDLAFKSTTILTNGGTSGPGSGGAYVQRATSFDGFTKIPADSAFRTDARTTPAYAIPTGTGNGWYNYDFSTNLIAPIPGNIIVVRTSSGKYAKVEILSYYKDAPATPAASDIPRYYTFRFIYQPDGTKNF